MGVLVLRTVDIFSLQLLFKCSRVLEVQPEGFPLNFEKIAFRSDSSSGLSRSGPDSSTCLKDILSTKEKFFRPI